MIIQPTRRGLLTGLAAIIAAPAIVRAESLMPLRGIAMPCERLITAKLTHNDVFGFGSFRPCWIALTSDDLSPSLKTYLRARALA